MRATIPEMERRHDDVEQVFRKKCSRSGRKQVYDEAMALDRRHAFAGVGASSAVRSSIPSLPRHSMGDWKRLLWQTKTSRTAAAVDLFLFFVQCELTRLCGPDRS
jgi:hypothetical protein